MSTTFPKPCWLLHGLSAVLWVFPKVHSNSVRVSSEIQPTAGLSRECRDGWRYGSSSSWPRLAVTDFYPVLFRVFICTSRKRTSLALQSGLWARPTLSSPGRTQCRQTLVLINQNQHVSKIPRGFTCTSKLGKNWVLKYAITTLILPSISAPGMDKILRRLGFDAWPNIFQLWFGQAACSQSITTMRWFSWLMRMELKSPTSTQL